MIAGFKQQFVGYVRDGSKTHTIRAGQRWRVGMRLDGFANVRTKQQRLVLRAPVIRVEQISIWLRKPQARLYADEPVFAGALGISINAEILSDDEANALAYRDGFRERPLVPGGPLDALAEMARFWLPTHKIEASAFTGQLIHWDYSKAVFE